MAKAMGLGDGSSSLVDNDDYDLFFRARNKDIEALGEEFSSLRRQQRVMMAMANTYLAQVPESRRAGVQVALDIHRKNIEDLGQRFLQTVKGIEHSQQVFFDSRMRMDVEMAKLADFQDPLATRIFRPGHSARKRRDLLKQCQESVSAVRSSMSDWSQSMSAAYRLIPVWRHAIGDMLTLLETQKEEHRAAERFVGEQEALESARVVPMVRDGNGKRVESRHSPRFRIRSLHVRAVRRTAGYSS